MARKVIIELEDSEYLDLVNLYNEFKKSNLNLGQEIKFEDYLTSIIRTNLEAKKQMDKMGDNFKTMIEMFNPSDMESVLKSIAKTFADKKTTKEPEPEKEAIKEEADSDTNDSEPKYKS